MSKPETIGWAVKQLWNGDKVRRSSWSAERHLVRDGTDIEVWVGEQRLWAVSMKSADLLATDWEIYGSAQSKAT